MHARFTALTLNTARATRLAIFFTRLTKPRRAQRRRNRPRPSISQRPSRRGLEARAKRCWRWLANTSASSEQIGRGGIYSRLHGPSERRAETKSRRRALVPRGGRRYGLSGFAWRGLFEPASGRLGTAAEYVIEFRLGGAVAADPLVSYSPVTAAKAD